MGGKLLFGDVSFKLEPRERMTLSGRNGAGKSTLLRMLAGELTPDSGSLVLQKGARVALHDQRPPRESEASLGEYVFSGRDDMIETEAELARLEAAMSSGSPDEETMGAYAAAQQRFDHGGGYRWRDAVLSVLRGLGFDEAATRAPSLDLLRRRADPRLPRPGARHPPRPAAARRAHQPPRHPLARVAGALPGRPRRRRRPRRPRPLVPRGGRHLGARARGEPRPLLRRPLARLAQGAGGARDRPRQGDRPPAGGDRADGAIRRALPLQGDQGQAGAVADQADRQDQARRGQRRTEGQAQPALLLRDAGAARPHRHQTGRRRRSRSPGGRCSRTRSSKSKGGSTSSSSAPTAPARRR